MSDARENKGEISANLEALLRFESQKKSNEVAYILWALVGGFGAHRFYLGRTASAIAMLVIDVLSWVSIGFGILFIEAGGSEWFGSGFIFLGAGGLIGIFMRWVVDAFLIPKAVNRFNNALINAIKRGDEL